VIGGLGLCLALVVVFLLEIKGQLLVWLDVG
jgi:hypothetical protein